MTKLKMVTLATSFDSRKYIVLKLTDSIRFAPGEVIDRTVVEDLCRDKGWKVSIIQGSK